MPGLADEAGLQAQLGGDARHHPDRQRLGLEHRPLLDMGFEIGQDFARAPDRLVRPPRVEPEVRQGLRQGHPILVGQGQGALIDAVDQSSAA